MKRKRASRLGGLLAPLLLGLILAASVEAQAREELRGLWSVDGFECTPADYRAQRCR